MQNKYPISPKATIRGLVYFRRMVDKIRLHTAGELAEDYIANLGKSSATDGRLCKLLEISYRELADEVQKGITDEQAWEWVVKHGKAPEPEQVEVYNAFLFKRGWQDGYAEMLSNLKLKNGFENRNDIQTLFDFIDADEERPVG